MSEPSPPIRPEELLAHATRLRVLARHLVGDANRADDVAQQALFTALETPPRSGTPLGPWLFGVARNLARRTRRAESRRTRHEAAAPEAPRREAGPDETAARAEAFRSLAAAVHALPQIHREVVVLHYLDELSMTQTAERLGLPLETARTRLRRALAALREDLDRRHGGDGRAWVLALLPLADVARGAGAATTGAAATTAALVTGGAVVAISAKTVIAAAVAGALVGGLFTAAAMSTIGDAPATTAEAPRAPAVAPLAPRPDTLRTGSSAEPAPAPEKRDARRAARAGESTVAADLPSWLDTVDVDLPPSGTGKITGTVRTKAGDPVAGVVVRATRTRARAPLRAADAAPPVPIVEEAVRTAAIEAKWRLATSREAVTGADGTFALEGVTDGPHWLGAWAQGWEIGPAPGASASDVRPGAAVDFVARTLVLVPTTILMPDGSTPKERVLVRWSVPEGAERGSTWWNAEDPVVHLEPGRWTLVAEVGEELKSAPTVATVAMGVAPTPLTLRLEEPDGIVGTVRLDPADDAWDSVIVTARRRDTGDVATKRASARAPDWRYRFADLEPGEYEVSVSLNQRTALTTAVVRVTKGSAKRDLAVPRLTPDQVLSVFVSGPDGKALGERDVEFEFAERGAGGSSGWSARGTQHPDGSLRVPLPERRTHDAGVKWFVVAKVKGVGSKEAGFDRGTTERVEIRFGEAAVFRPTIVGAEGDPIVSRLRVTLAEPGVSDFQALSASRRRPELPVPPGAYTALLWIANEGGLGRVVARIPVRLRAGENPVAIRVPELSSLTLRIPGGGSATKVYVSEARRPRRDVAGMSASPAADGTVTFEHLPAGLWHVHVTDGDVARETFVRTPAAATTFAPSAIAGFTVHVSDPAGLLARSGFRTGDTIVSIDGAAIDTFMSADKAIYEARERDGVPVEVERDGSRVTLTVDPSKLWAPEDHGGWWEPVAR